MNPHYSAFIELGKALAQQRHIPWAIALDAGGAAIDRIGWNLTTVSGDIPPPNGYLRNLGPDRQALAYLNTERATRGESVLKIQPLSVAWQDLIKAAVTEQLLVKRNSVSHVLQNIMRPLRVIATCSLSEPWQLTVEDMRLAIRVGSDLQASRKLGDLVIGVIKTVVDARNLTDAGPLYAKLTVSRLPANHVVRAKHTWSPESLRDDLQARKRAERLPARRAFWELIRIVMTGKPQTFMDELCFVALRTMIVTGFRIGETTLLPLDWKRERSHMDAKGRSAAESGGIATSLRVRHFAEKQQIEESDSRVLFENTQPVPEMFRDLLLEGLDRVATLTAPLRQTLRLQCETGRLLPWYRGDELVPVTEIYVRLVGNPIWSSRPCEALIQRYRERFDPVVLAELQQYQRAGYTSGSLQLSQGTYTFLNRLQKRLTEAPIALRFRRADGSAIPLSSGMTWRNVFLRADEIEAYVRAETPTKVSDMGSVALATGVVQPWEFMFLHPKRSLAEERNGGICDVTRYVAVGRPETHWIGVALGWKKVDPDTLFRRYGETDADRALTLDSHALRHLQNTELFRLGVADTIISKRFNRRSVAQSYDYDHRSLAESLDQIEIPAEVELRLGEKASTVAKLIKDQKASGPIVDAFRGIQAREGDAAAYEYLRVEADGFHATPYGHCLNSFTVDPCPKNLECFAGCRHLTATNLPENRTHLVRLEKKLEEALQTLRARPTTSVGWTNQVAHAEERLVGVQRLLATAPGEHPFPHGPDLSQPQSRGVLDD